MVALFLFLHIGKAVQGYSESLDLETQWLNLLGNLRFDTVFDELAKTLRICSFPLSVHIMLIPVDYRFRANAGLDCGPKEL